MSTPSGVLVWHSCFLRHITLHHGKLYAFKQVLPWPVGHAQLTWVLTRVKGGLGYRAGQGGVTQVLTRYGIWVTMGLNSMHISGTADASRSQSIEAAIQQRDSDISAYFDTQVLKHVLNPDHQKRALALTREICGLEVAHQQLIAAHAAAKKLAGAASLQSITLRQQLQVCTPLHVHVIR